MSFEHSFVRIYNGNPTENGTFIGTAFFITEQKLLTAAHVVQGCTNGVFLKGLADGSSLQLPTKSIEYCPKMGNWTPDIALLHCPTPQQVFPIITARHQPKNAESVTIYGFKDHVQSLMHRETHISGYVGIQDCWNMADGVHKGMSGGAVLREGELVGVLNARDEADKITSYFIPINVIHDWLGDSFSTFFDAADVHADETEQQRAIDVFVGRQKELRLLQKHLSSNTNTPVAITALHGMAGVGKSWLADHFYASHQLQFPGGYFRLTLDAEKPASTDALLAELAERCELSAPQSVLPKHLKIRLSSPRTLVHIENIDSQGAVMSATKLCKQLSGCSIVLSGRIENFGKAQRWQQISLKPFNANEGLAQLQSELEWLGTSMPEATEAEQLIKTLGGLPLAIHLAAGYLAQGYSVLEFLDELKQTGYELPPADASDDLLNRDAAKAVLDSTFRLSLRELAKQASTRKIDAADQLFANLGIASISGFGFSIAETLFGIPLIPSRSLLRLAQNLSLIDLVQAEPPRWQSHPLLSAYLSDQITELPAVEGRLNEWFLERLPEPEFDQAETNTQHGWHELNTESSALAEWLFNLPNDLQYKTERAGSEYATRNGPFIHWMLFCEAALNNPSHDEAQRSNILFTLMQVSQSSGSLEKAMSYAEEKYQLDTQREEHGEAALAKGKIADILQARGNLDEALRIRQEDQLPVYEQLGEVREIAITKGKIADILYLLGNLDKAFALREKSVLPALEQLGDKRSLLVDQANLAFQYLQSGKNAERAEELLLAAYQSATEMKIPEAKQIKGILNQIND